MNRSVQNGRSIRVLAAAALLALLGTVAGGPAQADDRDLLRKSAGEPYVFIVLDTSGSMHWAPRCPVDGGNAADCAVQCSTGDCFLQRNGDDPNSKFYQAKAALYEVIKRTNGIRFGFATYNQDQLRVTGKHWLYKAAGNGPNIPGYGAYPQVGDEEVFGKAWTCDDGSGDDEKGCLGTINASGTTSSAATLNNAWDVGRIRRLAKGGINFATTVTFYVRATSTSTQVWRIRYEAPTLGSTPGQPVTIRVVRDLCPNLNCTGINALTGNQRATEDVVFNPVAGSEFLAWDQAAARSNPQFGYFAESSSDLQVVTDANAANAGTSTCSGLDLNTDSGNDPYLGYNLRWPTDTSDPRDSDFDVGDLIPLDWKTYNRTQILQRLAPNTIGDPSEAPDFSVASYFKDVPNLLESFLRLKDEDERPIVNRGLTPLKNSVRSFRNWYSGCSTGTCAAGLGWKSDASAGDADWGCRRKYLLVLTDGDETCKGTDGKTACDATEVLKADGVLTYVVAFGVDKGDTSPNVLGCMASKGGTGAPVYPQNKQDLINALTTIFNQVKEEASAFASAAVPSVQAEVADRIYLSSFTPVDKKSVWDGHVDAFLKPLPLDAAGRPNESRKCSSLPPNQRSSCHLWDAGDELVKQAPSASAIASAPTLNASVLKIGPALDERRVFYGKAQTASDVPRALRLLVPPGGSNPATDPEWLDLFAGLKITGTAAAMKTRSEKIIAQTLVTKGTTAKPFVLGDIFHSDPLLIDRPNDFFFYGADLHNENGCGYKCFSDSQRYRRKLLVVGSNDGQLHFFDAGIWDDGPTFGTGTGRELFSFIPRAVLPAVRELSEGTAHIYGIDGTPRVDDVFIDPIHDGEPETDDREWRTVLIGGLREGGGPMGQTRLPDLVSGYYALDITQPDKMSSDGEPTSDGVVPDCLSLNGAPVSGCGTLPFPALLWEFTDSTANSRWDEDLNGFADLGETWSVPTVGRVKVTVDGEEVTKFVAIFGGGMDAERKANPKMGNWLYMVDVETGQPIYKRRVVGSVAADPAAIDVDVDGILDILYFGTSAGYLYKVDLSTAAPLEEVTLPKTSAIPHLAADVTTFRVLDNTVAVSSISWDPVEIFDATDLSTGKARPIYYAPVAFYVASQNRFALAFGTGDRENLWDFNGQKGRFFLIIDDNYDEGDLAAGTLPLDESDYQAVDPESLAPPVGTDYILTPGTGKQRGWYMDLAVNERVITQAFGLAGVVIFSSYRPEITNDTIGGEQICARTGESRIFVIYANNASAVMTVDGAKSRYRTVPEFVTNPYVEQGATKNPNNQTGNRHSEQLSEAQLEIMETLKKFFPACAKFGNYWISVSGIRSDTGYERYATVPIGICQRNWKEH